MTTQPEAVDIASQPPKQAQKKKKPLLRPRPQFTDKSLPKPSRLSTTATPLTNDPLWLDSLVTEGEKGLTSETSVKEFKADAAGYVSLVEHEYNALSDCDKHVAKTVPQSAYAYYHHVMWWYKVALIAQKHGRAGPEQERLIHFVNGYETIVGAGAATYLVGMGDYVDATGVKHYLTAREPNGLGHFGELNHLSHRDYETLIAPTLSMHRVLSDIAATFNRGGDFVVPEGIMPRQANADARAPAARPARQPDIEPQQPDDDDIAGGIEEEEPELERPPTPRQINQPTANLLGWHRSTILNKNQQAEMLNVIEDPEDIEYVIPRYCVHRGLFEFVYRRLREAQRYKITPLPKNTDGSVAQQLAWKPTTAIVNRHKQFIAGEGKVMSRTIVPTRIVTAARVFCYRSIRPEIDDDVAGRVDPWCCLHWGRYTNVPGDWRGNRNHYLTHGMPGLYDCLPFGSSIEGRDDAVVDFLNKFKAR